MDRKLHPIWPMFATANQLVAALALLTISVWLLGTKRPAKYTLIPCIVMLCITLGALLYEIPAFFMGGQYLLSAIAIMLLVLAGFILQEARKAWHKLY